jgi:large subunit ribosomal protein L2
MKKLNKSLLTIKKKTSGRDSQGHISVRHRGGEEKRFLRTIDWKRSKLDVTA